MEIEIIIIIFCCAKILSPTQSVFFKDILPEQKPLIDQLLLEHDILTLEEIGTNSIMKSNNMKVK